VLVVSKMVLFKHFKCEAKGEKGIHLPAENGPSFSGATINHNKKEANEAVAETIKLKGKCNPYLRSVDDTKKVEIASIL